MEHGSIMPLQDTMEHPLLFTLRRRTDTIRTIPEFATVTSMKS